MNNKMSIERIADRMDTLAGVTPDKGKASLERVADAIEKYAGGGGGGGGSNPLFPIKVSAVVTSERLVIEAVDKTYSEILTAYNSGLIPYVIMEFEGASFMLAFVNFVNDAFDFVNLYPIVMNGTITEFQAFDLSIGVIQNELLFGSKSF